MEERGGARWHNSSKDLVWRDAGKVDSFDDTKEHYYIPLSGFNPQWTNNQLQFVSCAGLVNTLNQSGIKELQFTVYGVRKGDIEDIKTRKNWINLEDHVTKVMDKLGEKAVLGTVRATLANTDIMRYNIDMIATELATDSPALKFIGDFVGVAKADNYNAIHTLTSYFSKNFNIDALINKYKAMVNDFNVRYPLINKLDNYNVKEGDIIGYIKLVDSVKTV
jgi:hypothetical protein